MTLAWIPATFSLIALLFAGTSAAAQDADYQKSGFYVGLNGIGAFELLDDAGVGDIFDHTGGLNVRAGYRVLPWLAADIFYEWADDFSDISGLDISTHSVMANAKLILPKWRAQPYAVFGLGALGFDIDAGFVDTTEWGFALRPGLGVDFFLTENLVLNAEWATTTGFFDSVNGNGDNQTYMSVGGGLQYRF